MNGAAGSGRLYCLSWWVSGVGEGREWSAMTQVLRRLSSGLRTVGPRVSGGAIRLRLRSDGELRGALEYAIYSIRLRPIVANRHEDDEQII